VSQEEGRETKLGSSVPPREEGGEEAPKGGCVFQEREYKKHKRIVCLKKDRRPQGTEGEKEGN